MLLTFYAENTSKKIYEEIYKRKLHSKINLPSNLYRYKIQSSSTNCFMVLGTVLEGTRNIFFSNALAYYGKTRFIDYAARVANFC